MRLVTANIGRKQNIQQTRADFETIRSLGGIVGFQEIDEEPDPAPEHAFLRGVLGPKFNLVGADTRVPVAVPKPYKVLASHTVFGTGGVKVWSPARYFVVAIIERQGLSDKLKALFKRNQEAFVVINTHYPAGAYHGTRPPAAKRELKKHWDEQFENHKKLVKKYVDRGYTVFWTGDVNRVDMPRVHPRERQVVTAGIDSISYVEGKVKVKAFGKGSRKLYSDHDALFANFKLG